VNVRGHRWAAAGDRRALAAQRRVIEWTSRACRA
jgi:hypothetical protein